MERKGLNFQGNRVKEGLLNPQPINRSMTNQDPALPIKNLKFKRFRIPPDLQMCMIHQQATAFGLDNQQLQQQCPCCHQILKTALKYHDANRKISYVNQPVGFYFSFIKLMLFGLLFVIVFPEIYTIVQISEGCQRGSIQCNYIYGIPFPEISAFYTWVSLALNAGIVVVLYILIGFLFYWNVLTHEKLLFTNTKASEIHSFLTGIDHALVTREALLHQLRDFDIQQVVYTYKIKEIMVLMAKKGKLQALRAKFLREGRVDKANKLRNRMKELDDKIIPIKNQFQVGHEWQMRTDKVFLKFKNKAEKYRFELQYKKGMLQNICYTFCDKESSLIVNGCKVYVQVLGDPREIVWQNLEVSSKRRYTTIFANNLTMLVILGLSFYFVVKLTFSEQAYKSTEDVVLSLFFSIIIQLINFALGVYIDFTTHLEGRYTLTGQTEIKIIKQTIVYFMNTTLIPFSLLIIESNRVTSNQDIVRNILTLFLVCNILSPLISEYLQIAYLLKVYKRQFFGYSANDCLQTQIKANQIFQKVDFNLESRYGFLFQRLTNCFFYAGIFPMGALITAIGLILTYFIAKKQLISLCSIPKHSFRLGILITNMAALLPFVYSLGTLLNLFTYNSEQQQNAQYSIVLTAICFPISLVFLLKGHDIAKRFVKAADIEASKINSGVEVEYKDLNPATFLLGAHNEGDSNLSTKLIANMIRFSALKDAIGMQRCCDRSSLYSQIREMEQEFQDQY